MKLPAALIPSPPNGAAAGTAVTGSATAPSMPDARPGATFGEVLDEVLGGAGAGTSVGLPVQESFDSDAASEPEESAGDALSAQVGHLAQSGPERMPASNAAMTQFWAAVQTLASQNQLGPVIVATPQLLVPADAPSGGLQDAVADDLAAAPDTEHATARLTASGPAVAAAAMATQFVASPAPGTGEAGPAALTALGGAPKAREVVAAPVNQTAANAGNSANAAISAAATSAVAASKTTTFPTPTPGVNTLATVISGELEDTFAKPAMVQGNVEPGSVSSAPVLGNGAAQARLTTVNNVATRPGGAITDPHNMGNSVAPAPEPGWQLGDGAMAPAPSAVPSLTTVPAVVPLPAAPAPAAPGNTQLVVPPGTPLLSEQLARPLFSLASAPLGEHIMTINVIPDALGPVTVRAHLAADGIRIEMMSASDAGREGLRSILADLRRDLAAGGLAASLSMAPGSGGQDHGGGHRGSQGSGRLWDSGEPVQEPSSGTQGRLPRSKVATAASNSLDITV